MRLDPVLSLLPKHCCPITLALRGKFEAGVFPLVLQPSLPLVSLTCVLEAEVSFGLLFFLKKKKQQPGLGAQEVAQQPEFDPWNPRGKRRGPTF